MISQKFLNAFDLVRNPETFTTGELARDVEGKYIDPLHPSACRFCSLGALVKIFRRYSSKEESEFMFFLREKGIFGMANLNDDRPHSEVVSYWEDFILYQCD